MRRRDWMGSFGFVLGSCGPRFVPVETGPEQAVHVGRPAVAAAPLEGETEDETLRGFAEVRWTVLRGLDTQTGRAPAALEMMAGTNVKIAGYMVPLDDDFQEVNEFLLVPTAGACVHTPAPPGNQIIYARMATGRPAKVELGDQVWACGKLEIGATESPYGAAGFKMGVVQLRRRG